MAPLCSSWPRLLLALGFCLSIACTRGDGEGGARPGATTERLEAGAACSQDLECREGLRCDAGRRACVCTSDASCGDLHCDPFTGRCVTERRGCGADDDCGPGRWCDRDRRVCRAVRHFCEPCDLDGDCAGAARCLPDPAGGRGFCGEPCATAADCSRPGTACEEGQCVPLVSCADVAPCTPDSGTPCAGQQNCAATERCDPLAAICVARNSGCAATLRCDPERLVCYAPCTTEMQCAPDERCLDGACAALPACTTDVECPAPWICARTHDTATGRCVRGCSDDTACPLGSICEAEGERSRCRPGCREQSDCPLHERCEGRVCVRGGDACQITDTCGSCEVCAEGRCLRAFDAAVPEANYCGACGGTGIDPACGAGGLCLDGRCAPACHDQTCPRGFVCERVRLGAVGALYAVCVPNDGICDTEC